MNRVVECVRELPFPPERVWSAFADGRERSQWEAVEYEIDPVPGGAVRWTLPGMECVGEVEEVVPHRLLRHTEATGPHERTEVCVTLEPTENGTRLTVRHALGEAPPGVLEMTTLGWSRALEDLALFLARGVPAQRFVRRVAQVGLSGIQTPVGLELVVVDPEGPGASAGIRGGDVLIAADGVALYTLGELWIALTLAAARGKARLEVLRGSERVEAVLAVG